MSSRSYFQHDDREDRRNVKTKKKWKRLGYKPKHDNYKRRGPRNLFDEDGDIDMGSSERPSNSRYKPYKGGPHYGRRYGRREEKPIQRNSNFDNDSDHNWYKIVIPLGQKLGRDFILKAITSASRLPFTPFFYSHQGKGAVFYVNGYEVACAIRDVSKRITAPDGFKLGIHMSHTTPPLPTINNEVMEKIKNAMSHRYNTMMNELDLSAFHSENTLSQEGLYLPLWRPSTMTCIVRIIKENIPQIEKLNLSRNKLFAVDSLTPLVPLCKNLKSLILKNNKLKSVAQLGVLRGMDLVELVLDGNPLCDNYKDQSTYISAVRERFPKIIKLDGQVLPPPVLFSLGTSEVLPASKGNCFHGDEVKNIVVPFLEQYYTIFDSNNRQQLLEAYHDQAVFSLTVFTSLHSRGPSLQDYITDSRNLTRIIDRNHRQKLLKQGRLSIVSMLSDMPRTQHEASSFTVDVAYVSQTLMCFTVTGVFREVKRDLDNAPLRAFNRTLVVVPQNQGFSIINETLTITNATIGQSKAYKLTAPTPSPSPAPSNEQSSEKQQQMVIEFSNQTGMNFEFSAKCLEENDWDFQKAANVFQILNAKGSIPIEAFQKR